MTTTNHMVTADQAHRLDGRVAIVTGGSAGIGLGIATAMAEAGADVAIAARRPEIVQEASSALRASGQRVLGIPTDVTVAEEVERLISTVHERLGRLDILVNNAGGSFGARFRAGPLLEMSPDEFQECWSANVKSAFLCCKSAVPLMLARGSGSVINVASIGGTTLVPPGMGFGAYSSAKAGLIQLTRAMAAEWGPTVRVNALAPGMIDTPRVTASRHPAAAAAEVRGIVMGRPGLPSDVAGAAVFLASDAAAWITGTCLDINGGLKRDFGL